MYWNTLMLFLLAHLTSFNKVEGFIAINVSFPNGNDYPELILLNHHLDTCGGVRWCLVQSGKLSANTCCGECGCDNSCLDKGNCCPDFDFMRATDHEIFENVVSFTTAFKTWSNDKRKMPRVLISPIYSSSLNHQCTSAQILSPSQIIKMKPSYYMTTTCGDSSSVNRDRCEYDNLRDMTSLRFKDLVPAHSPEYGTIYKNKHCAECNIGNSSVTLWSMYASCIYANTPNLFTANYQSPLSVINFIISQKTIEKERNLPLTCNIFFKPDSGGQQYKFECMNLENTQCHDSDVSVDFEGICGHFSSPIYIVDHSNGLLSTLNNAVCLKCRNGSKYANVCQGSAINELTMKLNVPVEWYGLDIRTEFIEVVSDLRAGDLTTKCQQGEVFDEFMKKCRKLFCPRLMFSFNDECLDMFSEIAGGTYVTYLGVRLDKGLDNATRFAMYLHRAISKANIQFRKTYIDLSIWFNGNTTFAVYLTIPTDEAGVTFAVAKTIIKELTNGLHALDLIEFPDPMNIFFGSSFIKMETIVDKATDEVYELLYPPDWEPVPVAINLDIREDHFCYRVYLQPDEYTFDPRFAIVYKPNNKIIWDFSQDLFKQIESVFVCREHVSGYLDEVFSKSDWNKEILKEGTDTFKEIIAPLIICSTTILLVSTCIIKERRRKLIIDGLQSDATHTTSI